MKIEEFIKEWFPKNKEWSNIAKFILDSGIQFTDEKNPKWLTGYTNIGISSKPHHKDAYIRYIEESMFMLHDIVHQIFTLNLEDGVTEKEYIERQIYGELFTFYLTEYIIPQGWGIWDKRKEYIQYDRDCYNLIGWIVSEQPRYSDNIIDWMWEVFINDKDLIYVDRLEQTYLTKYRKMFKQDLQNSSENFKFVPKGISYCIVGKTSQNHIDFFECVKKGAIKNIKREFNLKLPEEWI